MVAGTITYDMLNSMATFTPLSPLTISTTYIALVSGVTDIKGNGMASGIAPDHGASLPRWSTLARPRRSRLWEAPPG